MSNPENPLNYYRSHSYHHILIAANSTGVLDAMSDPSFSVSTLVNSNTSASRSARAADVHTITGKGSYVVVLNGMQDADFYIDDLKWESMMIPKLGTDNSAESFTTMGLDGTMKIVEPKGIRFMYFLNQCFDALECDPVGITFILKTIFMGYPDGNQPSSSTTNAQSVVNIKPLGFTMYDLVANFDSTGANYDLSFIGTVNGTTKLPQTQNITEMGVKQVSAYTPSEGESKAPTYATLDSVMSRFTKLLNDKYTVYYDNFTNKNQGCKFRKVTYEIKLDDAYTDTRYVCDNFQQRAGNNVDEGTIVFAPKSNIESALNKILQSSKSVLQDANVKDKSNRFIYKIHSTIDSTIPSPNEGEYKITFIIRKYSTKKQTAKAARNPDAKRDAPAIEFDYVFTGTNIDVIDFDMKMDTGLLFLMMLSPNRNLTTNAESLTNVTQETENEVQASEANANFKCRQNTPLFPPRNVTDAAVLHSSAATDLVNFRAELNRHAQLSAVESKLKIKGNPLLLNGLIKPPSEIISNIPNKSKQEIMGDWTITPGLVRVNVRMPSDNPSTESVTEPFWYQGTYQVISVMNSFNGGEFTQELDMMALPQINDIESDSTPEQKTDAKAEQENQKGAPDDKLHDRVKEA